MRLYTKPEFAKVCGLTTSNVTNYINRGKVVVDEVTQLIDLANDFNKAFYQARMNRKADPDEFPPLPDPPVRPKGVAKRDAPKPKQISQRKSAPSSAAALFDDPAPLFRAPEPDEPDDEDEDYSTDSGKPLPLDKSTRLKKHLDAIKTQKEIELQELKLEKQRGEVVPAETLVPLFLQHNQAITAAFKQSADDILREFAKMRDLTPSETARMRGFIVDSINVGMNKATEASIKGVEVIVNNYAETRGVGERR